MKISTGLINFNNKYKDSDGNFDPKLFNFDEGISVNLYNNKKYSEDFTIKDVKLFGLASEYYNNNIPVKMAISEENEVLLIQDNSNIDKVADRFDKAQIGTKYLERLYDGKEIRLATN